MESAVVLIALVIAVVVVAFVILVGRRDTAWKQLAAELGAEFVPGGLLKSSKVQAHFKQWQMTLDTYSVPSGDSNQT